MTLEHQLKKTMLRLGIVDPSVDRFHSLCEVISNMGTGFLISAHTFFQIHWVKGSLHRLGTFCETPDVSN